jgi:hypothetical protein
MTLQPNNQKSRKQEKMMKKLVILLALLALVACLSTSTFASVTVKEIGVAPGTTVQGNFGGIATDVWAGVYNLQIDNQASPWTSAFCIEMQFAPTSGSDLYKYVDVQYAPNTAGPNYTSMGAGKAQKLNNLFSNQYGNMLSWSNNDAAAFQVAIWKIVYDGSISPLVNISAPSGIVSQADGWVTLANTNVISPYNLVAVTNDTYQDYIFVGTGNEPLENPVPEASTLIGFGSALVMAGPGMIGWLKRRRS